MISFVSSNNDIFLKDNTPKISINKQNYKINASCAYCEIQFLKRLFVIDSNNLIILEMHIT